jgi:hypothetical protein
MRSRSVWYALGLLTALWGSVRAQVAGGAPRRAETLRGRVVGDSGRALPGVTVIATMAPDRSFRQAVTDSGGRYEIHFDSGTGDYLVYAAPTGYRAFRRRVSLATAEITVDIRLRSEAAQLAAVRVTAQRPRPIPDMGMLRDPTAADFNTQGVVAGVPPDLAGDLNALAANVPGMSVTPDGRLSVFGLPGQVQYAYNGSTLSAAEIPRDARVSVRVIQSAFDPSIGGFGGALINVEMFQGGRVAEMFGRATLDAPALQARDPVSSRLGQRFTAGAVNANWDGPIVSHDAFYNTAISVRRTTRDASSLFDASPDVLSLAGLAPDSINRLRAIASGVGLPLAARGAPSTRYDERGSFVARFDRYKDPARYGKLWTNGFSLTAMGGLGRSGFAGGSPTVAPTLGNEAKTLNGQLIAVFTHQNETYSTAVTSSLGGSRMSAAPYLFAPTAAVRIQSFENDQFIDRTTRLGGNDAPADASSSSVLWETTDETNFYVGSKHKMKLYGRVQASFAQSDPGGDRPGVFTYNSLADLEANRPSSFTRTFGGVAADATGVNAAFSVGDLFQVTPTFQLQPGVRVEANRFRNNIESNDVLLSSLGVTNTSTPNTVHASPRLGFAWQYRPTRANVATGTNTTGRISLPPRATLSGGIGEFRQDMRANELLGVVSATGLGHAGSRLSCIGSATPVPNWNELTGDPSAVPVACAAGAPTSLIDAVPSVTLFDPAYTLAHSWRANLRFGSAFRRFRYAIDGWYSYNLDQPGVRDLNLRDTPAFTLGDEGNRPVFVSPASIVPGTGLVSATESRRSPAFGRVTDLVSDLHSTARQVTFTVAPELDRAVFRLAYTLSEVTAWSRGFDDATFGSPNVIERSRSPFAPRHQLIVNTGYQFGSALGLSVNWRIMSGLPYTPRVGGDVNGDGSANDRAFVFDPSLAPDRDFGHRLADLLSTAPRQARDCLQRQLGSPAAKNSCIGPWTSTMNAALSTAYLHVLDGRYLIASINFANPLGGLDQVLHGSNHLHGWGTAPLPDPVLYSVQGFDAANNRFRYAINDRFGSTRPSQNTLRAPFRVTLDFRLELGRPVRQQDFARFLQMDARRGNTARAPVDSLRERLLDYKVTDIYRLMTIMRDSLLLTREQVDSLERLQANYHPRAEAVWQEIAEDIYRRTTTGDYDVNAIVRAVDDVDRRAWVVLRAELPKIRAILTPAQLELADVILKPYAESDRRMPLRPYLF